MQNLMGRLRRGGLLHERSVVRIRAAGSLFSPGLLQTAFNADCPMSSAESADGIVLLDNSIDAMLRWDGNERNARPAGVKAPKSAPTISGDNAGDGSGDDGDSAYASILFDFTR